MKLRIVEEHFIVKVGKKSAVQINGVVMGELLFTDSLVKLFSLMLKVYIPERVEDKRMFSQGSFYR
jgi:hypothetical protein